MNLGALVIFHHAYWHDIMCRIEYVKVGHWPGWARLEYVVKRRNEIVSARIIYNFLLYLGDM